MDDNKRKLYDALSQDYDMGSYEQFSNDVKDEGKRRKLYDAIKEEYDLPDFDGFSSQLLGGGANADNARKTNQQRVVHQQPKPQPKPKQPLTSPNPNLYDMLDAQRERDQHMNPQFQTKVVDDGQGHRVRVPKVEQRPIYNGSPQVSPVIKDTFGNEYDATDTETLQQAKKQVKQLPKTEEEERAKWQRDKDMQNDPSLTETIGKSVAAGFTRVGAGLVDALNWMMSGSYAYKVDPKTGQMVVTTPSYTERAQDKDLMLTKASNYMNEKADKMSKESQPYGGQKGFVDLLWNEKKFGAALQKGVSVAGESLPMTLSWANPYTATLNAVSMAGTNMRNETLENPEVPEWKRGAYAIGQAAIEQAVEKWSDPFFKYVGGAGTRILKGAGKEASKEIVQKTTKEAVDNIAKRIYHRLGDVAKDAAGEGLEEVVGNFGNDLLGEALDHMNGIADYGIEAQWKEIKEKNPDANLMDFAEAKAKEYTDAFLGGAMAGAYTAGSTMTSIKALEYASKIPTKKGDKIDPITLDVAQSFDEGYAEDDSQAMNDAKNRYELQRQRISEIMGEDGIATFDDNPVQALASASQNDLFTDEQKQIMIDYVNSKAAYDGMTQRVRDDIDSRIAESDAMISDRVHEDGMIHPATMKVDNRQVYIVGGNVVMNEDGTMVDREKSDESVIIRDAETGDIEFADPRDIFSIDDTIDAEEEATTAREAIRQQFAQDAAAKIEGKLPFNEGDVYDVVDDEGQPHSVSVIPLPEGSPTTQGAVFASIDGYEPSLIESEKVQHWADNANLARLQQEEEQRVAAFAERQADFAETPENYAQNQQENIPETAEQQPEVSDAMPMIGEGEEAEPDFTSVTPERGHKYLYNEAELTRDEANQFVAANKKAAEDALKKITDKKPKMGTSLAKYRKEITTWEGEAQKAQTSVDYWNAIAEKQSQIEKAEKEAEFKQATEDAAGRSAVIDEQKNQKQQIEAAKKMYGSYFDDDMEVPQDINELIAMNLPKGISWEGHDDVKGIMQEAGFKKRGTNGSSDTKPFNSYLAKKGDGIGFDDAVHSVYESPQNQLEGGEHRFDSDEIRNAMIDMFASANGTGYFENYVLNNRIAQAEKNRQAEDDYKASLEAADNAIIQATGMTDSDYNDWIESLESMVAEQNGQNKEEYFNNNNNEGRTEINASGNTAEGASAVQGQESVETPAQTDGSTGTATNADREHISLFFDEVGVNGSLAYKMTDDEIAETKRLIEAWEVVNDEYGQVQEQMKSALKSKNAAEKANAEKLVKEAQERSIEASKPAEEYIRNVAAKYGFAIDDDTAPTTEQPTQIDKREAIKQEIGALRAEMADLMSDEEVNKMYNLASDVVFARKNNEKVLRENYINLTEEHDQSVIDEANRKIREANAPYEEAQDRLFEYVDELEDKYADKLDLPEMVSVPKDTTPEKPKNKNKKQAIAEAEAEVNTEPTDAQKEAGNYKMGHVTIDGLDITIENPKGSTRSGKDASGKEWSQVMNNTYGYIRGTEGVDGDHIDVFLSDEPEFGDVYVVDQVNKDGSFDEHKVMYGFPSAVEAVEAYNSNYEDGWQGLGRISRISREGFKKWIESSHRKTKPFSEYAIMNTDDEYIGTYEGFGVGIKKAEKENADADETAHELVSHLDNDSDGEPVQDAAYTIEPTTYTNKKGKETPMHLVKFNNELTKEQIAAGKVIAKESKGWWDREQKGFMMRSEESAKALADKLSDNEEVADAQPLSAADMANVTTPKESVQETEETKPSEPKRLVSDSRMEELKERMRKKLGGQMNMGVDPEILAIGAELAVGYIERGATKFADYAKQMVGDLGDTIRPYLKSFYNAVRDMPEAESYVEQMDSYDDVRLFDVANFDKASTDAMAAAAEVVAEQEAEKQAEEGKAKLTEQRNEQRRKDSVAEDGTPLRKATTEDFDTTNRVYRHGKPYGIILLTRKGEQVDALHFSKPEVTSVMLHDGSYVDISELWVPDVKPALQNTTEPQKTEKKPKKSSKKSVNSQQMPDLFGDLFNNETENNEQLQTTNGVQPEGNAAESDQSEQGGEREQASTSEGVGQESARPNTIRGGRSTEQNRSVQPRFQRLEESQRKNVNNNHAERGKDYAPNSVDARINANIKAIELMKQLIENDEKATPEQMAVLRQYSGWGGLGKAFENEYASYNGKNLIKYLRELLGDEAYEQANMSRNSAYYTPANVIDTLWDIARAMGFQGGNVLEGSAGIGNIIGLMPEDMSERSDIRAVEIDQTTGNILKLLYPDAQVDIQGFEATDVENGSVDLAITNVPFVTGLRVNDTTGDKDLSSKFHDIHDFCIAKNIRKLREGGIGIFITSSGTLDNSTKLREWIVNDGNTDVVGAFRLNNETFGGTGATSDIIVVRKRVNGKKSANAIDVLDTSVLRTAEYDTGETKRKNGFDVPVIKNVAMVLNKYFAEHPEMMAGEMHFGFEMGDYYRATSRALYPVQSKNQSEMLKEWASSFSEKDWEQAAPSKKEQVVTYDELGEGVKEGSVILDNSGNICMAQRGKAVPMDINTNKVKGHTKAECLKAYNSIKDSLSALMDYQTKNEGDEGLKPLINALNKAYDDFVKTYGYLHKNTSISFLKNDVDFANIIALEKFSETGDPKTGKRIQHYGKTDVFSKRVIEKEKEPQPTNVKDAIISSLYVHGHIDLPWMVEQLNKNEGAAYTEDSIKDEIVSSGMGFENPVSRQMDVVYEYLSGNVREKLRQARENNTNGKYDKNIAALENVIPMNIPAHLIDFSLGSSWVKPSLYEEYVKEKTNVSVKLTSAGGSWDMETPYYVNEEMNRAMGVVSKILHKTIMGTDLIAAAINNKTIEVKSVSKVGGETVTTVDKEATQACAVRVDEIRQDFKDWARNKMQNDSELSSEIENIYNERFNNFVPKSIPDDFVPEYFGGASHNIKLRPHQAKAVIRGTTQPLLLAHEVGSGKTFTLISTAMEMRRLGTARKPMIVVQNATVGQFVESAKTLYPNAKILTIEDKDKNAEGRKNFYAKIKYNDWDMIVVPQSVFEFIPDSRERQIKYIQEKIDEKMQVLEDMKDTDKNSMIVRNAEKEIEKLEEELSVVANGGSTSNSNSKADKKKALSRQNAQVRAEEMLDRKTDDVENFDDMEIDAILVDEAHEYKHLGFATAMQRGVKGIDPSYSKKAQGVFLKAQAVLEKNNGKNVVFATGTPISNTAAEIWTFMRYLMPSDTMKEYGIYYFDDFVRNFGNLTQMLEFTTSGKFKEVNRFAGYFNLPELVRIWSSISDTVLNKEIEAQRIAEGGESKIPEMEGGKAQDLYLPQTRALRSIMKYVRKQLDKFEKMSGKEKKENSHIPLTMYGVAKAAAVDARLVTSNAEDDKNSKTNEAVRQTMRALKETESYKGTVSIFADNYQNKKSGFNLYEDIRQKLIDAGVPEEQIVVMKSGMSVKKKLEIFDAVNRGDIRVILGSTFTLGTGVNIQERLHTLIHLDAPNRPMDYTQRNGRILRQGNLHKQMDKPVRVLRFGVEDSLDVTAYQRLKTKGAIADSIMNGKGLMANSMENRSLEEEEDVFGDTIAQLSGSEYAMLKNQAEKNVRKYEAKLKQYEADQTYCHNAIPKLTSYINDAKRQLEEYKDALNKVSEAKKDKPEIVVDGKTFNSVEGMAEYIKEYNKKIRAIEDELRDNPSIEEKKNNLIVKVNGIEFAFTASISIETMNDHGMLFTAVHRSLRYSCPELHLKDVPVRQSLLREGMTDIVDNVMTGKDFESSISRTENYINREEENLSQIKERYGKPFEFTQELEEAREHLEEYSELMKKEMEEKEKKYAEMDADVEEASDIAEASEDEEDEDEDLQFRDSEELNNEYGSRWLDEQTNEDGRHTTQVKNTINSYRKFGEFVKRDSNGMDVSVLDASSGLGLGTEWMRENGINVDDVEPFPSENRTEPTYKSYDDIDKKYDYIISNAVLNVIPDDWRANVLHDMADKLKQGGKLVINVRGAESIKNQGVEGKTRTTLDDKSEILVHRPDGSIKAYQKGFTKAELKEWCQNELGEGYSVENATNANAGGTYDTAVVVTKLGNEYRDGEGDVLNTEESRASSLRAGYTERQYKAFMKRQKERMRDAAMNLAEKMNIADNVEIIEDATGLKGRKANAKGWHDAKTGKIVIILSNNGSISDIMQTVLHEGVAHYGLRKLFGENFDTFLYNVFSNADTETRSKIVALSKKRNWNVYTATEEYLARLAENTDFDRAMNQGWWSKIKSAFLDMLSKLGIKDGFASFVSDNELRYILWRSYKNLTEPNIYRNVFALAEDISKQHELKVGEYKTPTPSYYKVAEPETSPIAEYIDNIPVKHNLKGAAIHQVVSGRSDIEKMRGVVSDEAFAKIVRKYNKKGCTGIYLPANNLVIIFGDKVKSKEDGEYTYWHEQTHGFWSTLPDDVAKKYGRACIEKLEKEYYDIYRHISDNYNKEDLDNEACAYFVESIIKKFGADKFLSAKFNGNNEDLLNFVTELRNYLQNGKNDGDRPRQLGRVRNSSTHGRSDLPRRTDERQGRVYDRITERDRAIARDAYESMMRSGLNQFIEATQDSMLGLKKLYEAIIGKGKRIEDVAGFENAYLAENRMSSQNLAEQHEYYINFMHPLIEEIGKIAGSSKEARQELVDYMMAKHGLERNDKFAERDAKEAALNEMPEYPKVAQFAEDATDAEGMDAYKQASETWNETLKRKTEFYYDKFKQRDYAGLTALTGKEDVADAEFDARLMVSDYEKEHDTTDLWDRVREATQATLERVYKSGNLSKDSYERIRDMFQNYIPLQGWSETTSDEVYGYLTAKDGLYGSPIKHARGRNSKADDPIATIAMSAEHAINQANRNLMKQRFLTFVENHPSDLVSVNELWLHYNDAEEQWNPVFPDLNENDTSEEVERKVKAFEAHMNALSTEFPDEYKMGKDTINVPFKVVKGNLKEHQVLVKRKGRTYVLTINGNPRAAQALNGLTNPDVETKGALGNILRKWEGFNRKLSSFYTTRNPGFVASNLFRDMLYSNCMTWVKESPLYALRFQKNFARYNHAVIHRLLKKWEKGTLDRNNRSERLFYQFMSNGGETGYTSYRDIEEHKKAITAELKKQGSLVRKAFSILGMQFDLLNRSVENCARFAAFVTSIESGRTIDRSIYDAKEVSVNFNKKGSGGKMVDAVGQTKFGKFGGYLGGLGRLLYVFWSAGVQGMTNFGRSAKRYPAKFITMAAAVFTLGYLQRILAEMMGGGDGDDDDKDAYYNLPEYVRRSNICIRAGENWITIPLPIELRGIFGLGELASGVTSGEEYYDDNELKFQVASQVSQILPIDMLEGGGGYHALIPSNVKPMAEAYLNKSWSGVPIYRENEWEKENPEWTKAFSSTDQTLVDAARVINEKTGGSRFESGSVDINPARVEYMLNGYFGGYSDTASKLKKMAETAFGDREFEWRNMLVANRLIKTGDERTERRRLKNEYYKYLEEYRKTKSLHSKYKNAADDGEEGMQEHLDKLEKEPRYLRVELINDYRFDREVKELKNDLEKETDPDMQKKIEDEMYSVMREMVDMIHELDKAGNNKKD